MSNTFRLGAIEYAAESSFAEDSSTFDAHRLPILGAVDTSGLTWDKQPRDAVQQYLQGGDPYVLMGQGGSFTTRFDLFGHGSTMVGSPSLSAMETLWGYILGNSALSLASSTLVSSSPGTATAVGVDAATGVSAGGLVRVGALGDGDGNGQFYAVSTHGSNTLNMLTALDGAAVDDAVVHPVAQIYPFETPPANGINGSVPGLRFRLLTANLQYACHGCFPTAVTFSGLSPGERPQAEVTWQVARWAAVSATFPSALATTTANPAPVAAGSLFVNNVGTATSNKLACRSFSITYTLGMEPLLGPGGVGAYQSVVGCRRIGDSIAVSFVVDADASPTATPVLQGYGTGTTNKHILYTLNTIDGKAVGFYLPNVCPSNVPVQFADGNINRMRFEGMAHTSSTTTSALTLAAMRLGFA